jgi:ribose-phosphate pyrophosphokinase
MIEAAGADCIFTLDIHSPQIEGFYNIPIDDIPTDIVLTEYLLNSNLVSNFNKLQFISPKPNRVKKSKEQAESIGYRTGIGVNIAMTVQVNVSKGLDSDDETVNEKVNLIGDVKGNDCIIIDDMIITGETIIKSAKKLKENGANKVYAYITHYLMDENDLKTLENSEIDKVIITNSTGIIPKSNKIIMLSVGALLAEIIRRDYLCESMSEIYRMDYNI